MPNKVSLKYLSNFLWSLEDEFDLLNYEIEGIKVWQYQRFRIFNELALATGVYKTAHTKKTKFKDVLSASFSLFYYSVFSNPLCGNYTKEVLVFNTGRKVNVDGKLTDIYTRYFIEEEQLKDYEIIEELYENIHLSFERRNRKHQDYQQIKTFLSSYFSTFKFTKEQEDFISRLEERIYVEFNTGINLHYLFRIGYLYFKYDYKFYLKLLQKRKVKKVYLVCSYTYKKALIAAAKDLNIGCIELQHGTIDMYHFGYSYPINKTIDYFPDKFYVFGQFWKDNYQYPLKEENVIVKGFPYFKTVKEKYKHLNTVKNQITILSQGSIGNEMYQLFITNIDLYNDYKIIYKLHPGEYARWESDYKELTTLNSKMSNLEVVDHNKKNLYYYLAQSEYVIGVYSTAVYEALAFECKVILLNLPGIDYMSKLIENEYVGIAENFQDAFEQLNSKKLKNFPVNYFFKILK